MGLFDALVDVVSMPVRVAVDAVKLPGFEKVMCKSP